VDVCPDGFIRPDVVIPEQLSSSSETVSSVTRSFKTLPTVQVVKTLLKSAGKWFEEVTE
jgi:hypothetical protein